MKITTGEELRTWLEEDGAYDYYEDDIIKGYIITCAVLGGHEFDDRDEMDTYAEGYMAAKDISLEDTNGVEDLTDELSQEFYDTIDPITEFVDDHINECTEHIKDKTITKYLSDNVELGDCGSDDYFDYILDRIDSLI